MEHWGIESRLELVKSWFTLSSPKACGEMKQGDLYTVEEIRCFGARQDGAQILTLPVVHVETWDKSLILPESLFLNLESESNTVCLLDYCKMREIVQKAHSTVRCEKLYKKLLVWFLAQHRHLIQLFFSPRGFWNASRRERC